MFPMYLIISYFSNRSKDTPTPGNYIRAALTNNNFIVHESLSKPRAKYAFASGVLLYKGEEEVAGLGSGLAIAVKGALWFLLSIVL